MVRNNCHTTVHKQYGGPTASPQAVPPNHLHMSDCIQVQYRDCSNWCPGDMDDSDWESWHRQNLVQARVEVGRTRNLGYDSVLYVPLATYNHN
jgi:hypothetical protein